MKHPLKLSFILLFAASAALHAGEIALSEPLDYQVVQRTTRTEGELHVRGNLKDAEAAGAKIEARIVTAKGSDAWRTLAERLDGDSFNQAIKVPAGGWYQLEVRALAGDKVVAESKVEHVGIGEIFVVVGQSNSANHGEARQLTETGRVAAFDGNRWQLANDPQPGASGKSGSFMPPFGDAMAKCLDVPVGFIACGIGATSVREWLPKGAAFPNPPTIETRVTKLPSGEWASKGDAFAMFVSRMKQAGNRGFRAVLWHQGESDANQKDPSRTLPGKLYREYLERIIRESRREIGWDAPWFVAQASYHVPGDEASPEIRDAQASLWKDDIALEGPDTDALKGELRERNGQGVHFSAKGLREHAARWAEKVCPWIEQELR